MDRTFRVSFGAALAALGLWPATPATATEPAGNNVIRVGYESWNRPAPGWSGFGGPGPMWPPLPQDVGAPAMNSGPPTMSGFVPAAPGICYGNQAFAPGMPGMAPGGIGFPSGATGQAPILPGMAPGTMGTYPGATSPYGTPPAPGATGMDTGAGAPAGAGDTG